jgi:hypothetical protein
MRVLLGTHIFLWWDNDIDRLSDQAKSICQDSRRIDGPVAPRRRGGFGVLLE